MMSLPFREWGTRFDSLSTSPSPSNSSSLSRNPQTTTRAATSTASSSLLNPQATAVTPAKFPPQSDTISNEPSVFVGSLPTTVDHTELSARLREHLSAYVEINFVRIIRDSRGGVCAFVQCNDPASAAQLIHTVRSLPPQSFMGRYLRLEPARSQRTLWISYRKPVEIIRDADRDQSTSSYGAKSRVVEFDLPKAMRVYRTLGSRRIEILYNSPALQFDDNAEATLSQLSQEQDDPTAALSSSGLLLSPLQFDAKTLHRIASSFGPVESFDHRQPELVDDQERLTYPYPHNADRSAGMDPGCWEVKWENRDDCLTALAALRNVPHLTVTWPNQQHALIPRRSGFVTRGHQVRGQSMVKRKLGPQHIHIRGPFIDNNNMASQAGISMNFPASKTEATVDSRSSERLSCLGDADPPTTTDCWTVVESGSTTDFRDVPLIVPDVAMSERPPPTGGYLSNIPPQTKGATPEQGDVVFGASAALSQASNPLEWSEVVSNSLAHSQSETLASSPPPFDTPTHCGDPQSPTPAPSEPFVDLASPFAPRGFGNGHPRVGRGLNFYDSFTIPPAPQWSDVRPRRPAGLYNENVDINTHNALDTTTIFVGGLEVHGRCTWDEHRLRRVFGQYGEIVEVKLVRPAHRKSAFAFVTYKNNKSSSRAVLEEHNRIYDGRYIRVQLRDSAVQKTHGSKSHFRSSEGRPFSPRHQFSSKTEGPPAYDSPLHVQNGIRPAIPAPCEELATAFSRSPNSTACHLDRQAQLSENTCVQGIPLQAPSTVSSAPVPSMTYPPPPHTAFYAPTPWYMPYPYAPTPHILPRYPQLPLASHVINETGRHIPPHSIYQPMPHYSVYPLPLPPILTTGQQHADLAGLTERRAPLQPTGFIESEQGLIPVYAPEALGEYMANTTSSRQNPPEAGGTHSAPHPPMMAPETRLSQPTAMYAVYPPPQYHPSFARDRGTMMMAGLSQQHPSNTNLGPVGNGYTWYPDTVHPDIRTQTQANLRVAPLTTPQFLGTHHAIPPSGQPPRAQSTYSERGIGLSKRRGLGDRSTLARISRGNDVPGTHATRRRGHFKHIGGAVSMSAVMDQTVETCLDDVADAVDPIVRASTSSPAVFDLTPISPAHGPQL
ncbi:hypothetical protein EDB89DRAFT_1928239 [Lactarius sanguifluus]|nr:hypothetical protein EDB89DRAFT_1928239 [Lactarius sanguifluus]